MRRLIARAPSPHRVADVPAPELDLRVIAHRASTQQFWDSPRGGACVSSPGRKDAESFFFRRVQKVAAEWWVGLGCV